jgi:L-asparaginase
VDDKLGFFASDEQNPQKSRILLSLALRRQRAPGEMQKRFLTY